MTDGADVVRRRVPQDRVITRQPKRRRDWAKWGLGTYFVIFLVFLYAPMILMAILSFQGYYGGVTFPFRGPVGLNWWRSIFETQVGGVFTHADEIGAAGRRSLWVSLAAGLVVAVLSFSLSMAFRRRFRGDGVAFYVIMLALMTPGLPARPGDAAALEGDGYPHGPLADRPRRQHGVGHPVRVPGHARSLEPLRRSHRGGGARPRRQPRDDVPRGDAAARLDGALRRRPVRVHADVERLRPHRAARARQHPAARDRRPDPGVRDQTGPLRPRYGHHARDARPHLQRADRGHDQTAACAAAASSGSRRSSASRPRSTSKRRRADSARTPE